MYTCTLISRPVAIYFNVTKENLTAMIIGIH